MSMFELRESRIDREDQLDDLEQWDDFIVKQEVILLRRIQEAKDAYDKHVEHMQAREVFRQKLVESLR